MNVDTLIGVDLMGVNLIMLRIRLSQFDEDTLHNTHRFHSASKLNMGFIVPFEGPLFDSSSSFNSSSSVS